MRPQQPTCLNCSQDQPQRLSWPETPFSERYFCLSDFKHGPGTTASWDPGGFYSLAVHPEKLPGCTSQSPLPAGTISLWHSLAAQGQLTCLLLATRGPKTMRVWSFGSCSGWWVLSLTKLKKRGDFPGSPVVKMLCFQCRGPRLSLKGLYVLARPKQ